jgi:hypothetical protein
MSDALKDFIQKNREGFKEKPSDELWKKIDATLKQENSIYKPKNISIMLKYGFGASLIIAGTLVVMNLQKGKPELAQKNNNLSKDLKIEPPASSENITTAKYFAPIKKIRKEKIKKEQIIQNSSDISVKKSTDTVREAVTSVIDTTILYGSHPPVRDTLDINNWPSAGSQRKKYSFSADNTSGKTIGCFKSLSKKVNGFITAMQSNVPDKYLGKRIRMTGYVRAENVTEWAGLWMRVGVKGGNEALAFDNMRYGKKDRSIKGITERTKYEIVLDVPLNSANIIYGVMLVGTGQIYFDSFILEIVDDSVPTTGVNPYELNLSKTEKAKSYNPRNFWRWYVVGRTISKDGTWNIDLEPNNF